MMFAELIDMLKKHIGFNIQHDKQQARTSDTTTELHFQIPRKL